MCIACKRRAVAALTHSCGSTSRDPGRCDIQDLPEEALGCVELERGGAAAGVIIRSATGLGRPARETRGLSEQYLESFITA